jgi:Tfp pilus assembly protein PilN
MDLIPADFRQAQWVRRFVRGLARAVLGMLLVCAVGWLLLSHLIKERNHEIAQLQEQDGSSQQQQITLNELRLRKQQVQQQLSALAALRGGERVANLLQALDNAYQEGVWLSALSMHPQDEQMRPNAGAKPTAPAALPNKVSMAGPGNGHLAEIKGHALDHRSLATFMQSLGRQPGITQLSLLDTRSQTLENNEVLDFSLIVQLAIGAPP